MSKRGGNFRRGDRSTDGGQRVEVYGGREIGMELYTRVGKERWYQKSKVLYPLITCTPLHHYHPISWNICSLQPSHWLLYLFKIFIWSFPAVISPSNAISPIHIPERIADIAVSYSKQTFDPSSPPT
jgi:hypothetical protein